MSEENWNYFEAKELFSIVRRLHLHEALYDKYGWHAGYSQTVIVADRSFFRKEYSYGLRCNGGEITLSVDLNTVDHSTAEYLIARLDSKGGVTLRTDEDIENFFWPNSCSEMVRQEIFRKFMRDWLFPA